jgi:hypothetical protein
MDDRKTIRLEGRTFIVFFDETGKAVRVKERLLYMPGHPYLECWHDRTVWSATFTRDGKPKTNRKGIVYRVIEAAKTRQTPLVPKISFTKAPLTL